MNKIRVEIKDLKVGQRVYSNYSGNCCYVVTVASVYTVVLRQLTGVQEFIPNDDGDYPFGVSLGYFYFDPQELLSPPKQIKQFKFCDN